jgi:hypothetical protein
MLLCIAPVAAWDVKQREQHLLHALVFFFPALACMRWNFCAQCGYIPVAWLVHVTCGGLMRQHSSLLHGVLF